ncbi:MAG: hypothetical protein QW189_04985 [Thermofilaceae archaeon]
MNAHSVKATRIAKDVRMVRYFLLCGSPPARKPAKSQTVERDNRKAHLRYVKAPG